MAIFGLRVKIPFLPHVGWLGIILFLELQILLLEEPDDIDGLVDVFRSRISRNLGQLLDDIDQLQLCVDLMKLICIRMCFSELFV